MGHQAEHYYVTLFTYSMGHCQWYVSSTVPPLACHTVSCHMLSSRVAAASSADWQWLPMGVVHPHRRAYAGDTLNVCGSCQLHACSWQLPHTFSVSACYKLWELWWQTTDLSLTKDMTVSQSRASDWPPQAVPQFHHGQNLGPEPNPARAL